MQIGESRRCNARAWSRMAMAASPCILTWQKQWLFKAPQQHYLLPKFDVLPSTRTRGLIRRKLTSSRDERYLGSWNLSAVVVSDPAISPRVIEQQNREQFLWERQWWPVLLVEHLDTKKPRAVTLLGRRFVVWHAGDGTWRCFDDVCPHRLAPLSEGRIETDGTLQCSYHGWRFNEQGRCTLIPQSEDAKAAATACASPRSAVRSYPTQVQAGMLFVFPDPSAERHIHAAACNIPIADVLRDWVAEKPFSGYMRDVPYSYEILLENVLDPSHVPFSHSGVGGFCRELGGPMPMTDATNDPINDGATCLARIYKDGRGNDIDNGTIGFYAPLHVRYFRTLPGGGFSSNHMYLTPIKPGRARLFLFAVGKGQGSIVLVKMATQNLLYPPWRIHVDVQHEILDGDSVFLHHQDAYMRRRGLTTKDYYMPTTADTLVRLARQWIADEGGGGPIYPKQLVSEQEPASRQALLDRYHSHTAHCKVCSAALAQFKALQAAAAVVAAALFLVLCATASPWSPTTAATAKSWAAAAAAAAMAVCGGAYVMLGKYINQFIFVDYVHAHR